MGEEKQSRLSPELEQLIHEDIEMNLARFEKSGFEQKLTNRIDDGSRERRSPSRWVLLPVFSLLVLAVIFLLPTRNQPDHPDSLFVQIQKSLETVIQDSPGRRPDPVWGKHPVQSRAASTSMEELPGLISAAILTVEGSSEIEVTFYGNRDQENLRSIRKGICHLHSKDDYSELFSRIMNKLTEG